MCIRDFSLHATEAVDMTSAEYYRVLRKWVLSAYRGKTVIPGGRSILITS